MKVLIAVLAASALFGADAHKDPKDAEIARLNAKVAYIQAQLEEATQSRIARDTQIGDMNAIYFSKLAVEINKAAKVVETTKAAYDAKLAESCKIDPAMADCPKK
jgi:hypothetical protein